MTEYDDLVGVAKLAVKKGLSALDAMVVEKGGHYFSGDIPKEMKAEADLVLERIILDEISATGISVLSEESGRSGMDSGSGFQWIIDPLDGTVNFMRSIGTSAVSVGLWNGLTPVFGVIGEFPSGNLYWGGANYGAFLNDESICVSGLNNIGHSILCSGFPARYDFANENFQQLGNLFSEFAKIRMLGAASISILQVARGSAEAYFESDIMAWDVAAGLAILEGAGGQFSISSGRFEHSYNVFASNAAILLESRLDLGFV